jgi:hypothetical protein
LIPGFLNNPLCFGFNSAEQENPFLRIFKFYGPFKRQTNPIFCHVIFLKETKNMGRRCQHEEPWGEKITHHTVPLPGHVVGPISHLVGPFLDFFTSTDSTWPKSTIYMIPRVILWWGGGETQNTRNGSKDREDRMGDVVEAAPDCPSPLSTPSPSSPWWRWSSSYLDYGIVEVICINPSIVLH